MKRPAHSLDDRARRAPRRPRRARRRRAGDDGQHRRQGDGAQDPPAARRQDRRRVRRLGRRRHHAVREVRGAAQGVQRQPHCARAVELAKDWRTDRVLRRLEALLLVADREKTLLLSGTGDVIEPDGDAAAIGSGGPYALAAARALLGATDAVGARDRRARADHRRRDLHLHQRLAHVRGALSMSPRRCRWRPRARRRARRT